MSKNAYAEKLTLLDPLREPLFRSLIHSLKLTEGSRGLDIGCGICAGDAASLIKHLAGLVKPGGSVFVLARKSLKFIEKWSKNHKFSGNSNIF